MFHYVADSVNRRAGHDLHEAWRQPLPAAVLLLAERGRLDLDASIGRDLDGFPPEVADVNGDLLRPESRELLLGGFDDGAEVPGSFGYAGGAPGVSAVALVSMETDRVVVVLSNFDSRHTEALARRAMEEGGG